MRNKVLLAFISIGAAAGIVAAFADGWAVGVVMAALGAIAGAAVGGAIVGIGHLPLRKREIPGMGTTSEDISANFWRGRGHPPV